MTVLLTLAVYSLKVSSDFPTQSLYLPYVSIYFTMGYIHTFISLLWFCAQNYAIETKQHFWWINVLSFLKGQVDNFFNMIFYCFEDYGDEEEYLDPSMYKQVCNKCDLCINCLKDKKKGDKKDKAAKELKAKCEQVNKIIFALIFFSTLVSYTTIWAINSTNNIY